MVSFKLLETFLENTTLNLIIKKTSTGIVVSVLPIANVDDKAKENLIPLIIKGTAEELDQEFMQLIQPELTSVTGIISNVAEFEAHAKEMKDKSEAEKKAKESKKKANETSKKALEGAEKLLAEEKYDECQKAIDKALENNAEYKPAITLQNKLNKAKPEDNQVDIFNVIEEETAEPTKRESPKGPNVIINKVGKPQVNESFEKPNLTPSPEKQEKVEAMLDEEEAIAENTATVIAEVASEEAIQPIEEIKVPQSLAGTPKPRRYDMESLVDFDKRLDAWEAENPVKTPSQIADEHIPTTPNTLQQVNQNLGEPIGAPVQLGNENVSLPPQTPKPIEPNNSFGNEVKATSNNPFEPTNPEQELWEAKGFDRGNNNEPINFS